MPHPANDLVPAPAVVANYLYCNNKERKPSLQSQVCLGGDRNTLDEMVATIRDAAMQHFDLRPSAYRKQRQEAIQKVKDHVMRNWAHIRRFQDGWPITRYIHIFLKNYHPKPDLARGSRGGGRTKPGPGRNSVGFTDRYVGTRRQSAKRIAEQAKHEPDPNSSTSLELSAPHTQPSLQPDLYRQVRAESGAPEEWDVVRNFLSSLRIPAVDARRIAILFEEMGIESQEYLEIFAAMETRDWWLYELLEKQELKPIQVRVLREGLDKIRYEVGKFE